MRRDKDDVGLFVAALSMILGILGIALFIGFLGVSGISPAQTNKVTLYCESIDGELFANQAGELECTIVPRED